MIKMHNDFLERMKNRPKSENRFLNFYFLNVDISRTMHDLNLKIHICITNIDAEGTISQICYIPLCSFFMNFEKIF